MRDTGIGISQEYLAHLFEPYSRDASAYEQGTQGSGLGLAIVKAIVDRMGGRIAVRSELGQGSAFSVHLELLAAMQAPAAPAAASIPPGALKDCRVLLAEDNATNARITTHLLEREGVRVERAENGRVAVERFRESPMGHFDAVLMDIRMPEMDGPVRCEPHPRARPAGRPRRAHPGHDGGRLWRGRAAGPGRRDERPPGKAHRARAALSRARLPAAPHRLKKRALRFFAPDRQRRAGVPAGLLGPWPKRSASWGVAPSVFRPGPPAAGRGSGRLIGPVAQTLGLQGRCPIRFSPRTVNGGPGFRPAYWARGPNARPPGALPPPFFRPGPPTAGRGPPGEWGLWPKRSASWGVAPLRRRTRRRWDGLKPQRNEGFPTI